MGYPMNTSKAGFDGLQKDVRPCALDEICLGIGRVNIFMPVVPKTAWAFWRYHSDRSIFCKIFVGEILIRK